VAVAPRTNGFGATSQGSGASLTITKPSGVVNGDFILMWIEGDSATDPTWTGSGTWTREVKLGSGGMESWLYWKIASGEPSSYTINAGSGNIYGVVFGAYSGASSTQPDVTTQTATGSNSGTVTVPATATQPSNGCYELVGFMDFGSAANFTTPTNFTDRQHSDNFANAVIYLFDQGPLNPTGVLPAVSSTHTGTAGWSGFHLVIRASAGGAVAIPELMLLGCGA
jgi:hypothetical protein